MRKTYVDPADSPEVFRLKIHCWAVGSNLKAVSPLVELGGRSTGVDTVPAITWIIRKPVTVPGAPMEFPLASPTRNLIGTVRPPLNTLLPFAATGCRTTCEGSPSTSPAGAQMMLIVPGT